MSKFYPLKVMQVDRITEDSVAVSLDVPQDFQDIFNYKSGQYLTLRFNINGEEVHRSYSLCSSPFLVGSLKIGVKRVKDGLVSNHINNTLKAGDIVEVMPPDGRFFAHIAKENYKTYYLFAAGSGITPILSILKTVLHTEEHSFVHMIYGNRNEEAIMFKEELKQLQKEFPHRLILRYTLSRPKSNWGDLWSSKKEIKHRKGRIDSVCVKWFIDEFPPYAQNAEYYICGPGTMIENTKKALQDNDVPENRIFIESFGGVPTDDATKGFGNAQLKAILNGEVVELSVPEGKTLLRTLIDAGKEPPYSCEGGVCATCMCKLKEGKVHMKNNLALDEKEVEQGYILSCQSIPLSATLEIEYE